MIGAFLIGLFGSLHCIGMCGPIMLSLMNSRKSLTGFLWYHAGRILTYIFIGSMLGAIGAAVSFFHFQQVLAFLLGLALIVLYGVPKLRAQLERYYYQSALYQKLKMVLAKNLSSRKRWFLGGLANGFFPCGLTYVAAAGAVATGSIVEGVLFMALFGFGTIPAIFSLSFFSNYFAGARLKFLPNTVSLLAILSGSLLIFRGVFLTFPNFKMLVEQQAMSLMTSCGL